MEILEDFNPIDVKTGQIDSKIISIVRQARDHNFISGYSAAVIVAGLGLFEIALDRDRSFKPADIEKYNAWFKAHLISAGIVVSKQDDLFYIKQDPAAPNAIALFDDLPILKADLFYSIAETFAFRPSRKEDVQLMTRRRSFSGSEKSLQMDQIIGALANQANVGYDPETGKFAPLD